MCLDWHTNRLTYSIANSSFVEFLHNLPCQNEGMRDVINFLLFQSIIVPSSGGQIFVSIFLTRVTDIIEPIVAPFWHISMLKILQSLPNWKHILKQFYIINKSTSSVSSGDFIALILSTIDCLFFVSQAHHLSSYQPHLPSRSVVKITPLTSLIKMSVKSSSAAP